mmetsp:Transcript_22088/g.32189  ORF Transcript_22088/g.32189 Transcript_22088/m.32189 type:complete len:90 (+) Transcript_22088:40-309(+)
MLEVTDLIRRYTFGINVISFLAFGLDKLSARNSGPRISENALCILALSGGWPLAAVAMLLFSHKTRKTSFLVRYMLSSFANIIVVMFFS